MNLWTLLRGVSLHDFFGVRPNTPPLPASTLPAPARPTPPPPLGPPPLSLFPNEPPDFRHWLAPPPFPTAETEEKIQMSETSAKRKGNLWPQSKVNSRCSVCFGPGGSRPKKDRSCCLLTFLCYHLQGHKYMRLWPFLRSTARAPTIKVVRGTIALGGIFDNYKGHRFFLGGGSVPLTGLFNCLIVGRGPGAFDCRFQARSLYLECQLLGTQGKFCICSARFSSNILTCTITHKKITELIPELFRFGNFSTQITEYYSQRNSVRDSVILCSHLLPSPSTVCPNS